MPQRPCDSTDKHVGSRVKMRRLMRRMNQRELGDALGVTFQQVQKYENGTNRISASRLQQAAHVLKVPVEFFFEGGPTATGKSTSTEPSPTYITEFVSSAEGIKLVKAFTAIKDRKLRGAIVDVVKGIAGHD